MGREDGRAVRTRRSHAERTAETRARILAATLQSIADVGFPRTTASEITRRAGVTWGAVQHHFGDKDGILTAVLDDSFRHFESLLSDVPIEGASIATRVDLFVDRAWRHFGSPEYCTTFEILLNAPAQDGADDRSSWQHRMFVAWDRTWRRLFADSGLPRRRQHVLQHYTISTLSGLATTLRLESADAVVRPGELDLLKQTLVRELTRPTP